VRKFCCTFSPWIIRKQGGATTPEHWNSHGTDVFDGIDPASQILMNEVLELAGSPDWQIVDLGCNVGRHLDYLHKRGLRNLIGVDWSSRAINDMADRYPDTYSAIKTHVLSFQHYLNEGRAQADIVYSRGATFELVHPSYPLIPKVAQHAKYYVILVISEAAHAYPRFWEYEFAREGFELAHQRRPASTQGKKQDGLSLMTFRRI